ncbi:MAG TPA: hypothetical protein VF188_03140 [Longimicrobiales bacterium]
MWTKSTSMMILVVSLALYPGRAAWSQMPNAPGGDFQTSAYWAVGYAVNAPTQLMGFSTVIFSPGLAHWGVYADYKRTLDSPEDGDEYDGSVTPSQAINDFNDRRTDDESVWTTVNVGIVRVLTGDLAVYAGAGYAREEAYEQYFDDQRDRGVFGYYWVKDDAGSGNRLNLLAGAWLRATPGVLFQFGAETAPRGFTVGAALVLPFLR